jgi:hypothetical protein
MLVANIIWFICCVVVGVYLAYTINAKEKDETDSLLAGINALIVLAGVGTLLIGNTNEWKQGEWAILINVRFLLIPTMLPFAVWVTKKAIRAYVWKNRLKIHLVLNEYAEIKKQHEETFEKIIEEVKNGVVAGLNESESNEHINAYVAGKARERIVKLEKERDIYKNIFYYAEQVLKEEKRSIMYSSHYPKGYLDGYIKAYIKVKWYGLMKGVNK